MENDEVKIFEPYLLKIHRLIDSGVKLNLVFVGIDRYPNKNEYSGIPFCKKKWNQFTKSTAGAVILKALRMPMDNNHKENPTKFFEEELLLKNQIAFINISYAFCNGRPSIKDTRLKDYYLNYNKKILENTKNIVLCGNVTHNYFDYMQKQGYTIEVEPLRYYHPSARRYTDEIKKAYEEQWGEKSELGKLIK